MRQPSLAERQEAAAAVKKALLERHREKLNDPGFTERQAARKAVIAAREIRIAERGAAEEARKLRKRPRRQPRKQRNVRHRKPRSKLSLPPKPERKARGAAARLAAAEARAARDRELEAALLDTRKARKAARKAKKRGR